MAKEKRDRRIRRGKKREGRFVVEDVDDVDGLWDSRPLSCLKPLEAARELRAHMHFSHSRRPERSCVLLLMWGLCFVLFLWWGEEV